MLPGKDIAEPHAQPPQRLVRGIARQRRAAAHAQGAQVIDAVGVIGMIVGPQHTVDPADPGGEQLVPQIGRRIDQEPRSVIAFHHDRHARAAVARLGPIPG